MSMGDMRPGTWGVHMSHHGITTTLWVCLEFSITKIYGQQDGSIGKIFATQGCGPIFWIMDVVTEWHFSVVPTQLQRWEVEIKGS